MKHILFLIVFVSGCLVSYSQSLPLNTCGVVYTYDAAGNRTQRAYVCNNSVSPGVVGGKDLVLRDSAFTATDTIGIQQVTALYPNPTTGQFVVTFTKALSNAVVTVVNVNGQVMQSSRQSGYRVQFDVSGASPGVYFIVIKDGANTISQKVIKL